MVKYLDKNSEAEVTAAIRRAEHKTSGEIRVHLRRKCKGDVFEAARKIFHKLRMHKTKHRNAVLIYVALDSRQFAVLGDRGIHEKVGDLFWKETRDKMKSLFSQARVKEAIVAGVMDAGEKLKYYFPTEKADKNELSDTITAD
ncbi:MAG: hypothetical protein A3C47_01780 [Omnitrophica bacterium RIFCSPHIGHO2_02_FULL_51_18]|nr:MAG: hypothetical protein A3C47_01780 [Omnitrophica bacterium RIFCSPHIGHO2_02_FULL_51_18]